MKTNVLLLAIRTIAKSYRERIDRADTKPYELAQDVCEYLGIDLEMIPTDQEAKDYRKFLRWRDEWKEKV